jgi:hypothetical protein
LEETHPQLQLEKQQVLVMVGTKYTIEWTSANGDNVNIKSNATTVWDKSNCVVTSYRPWYLEWLCSNVLAELGPNVAICGCTEHKRSTQSGEKYILCAPPAWHGGNTRHDWAVYSWEDDDGTSLHIPAHIITFVELDDAERCYKNQFNKVRQQKHCQLAL